MKTMVALVGGMSLVLASAGSAFAQEENVQVEPAQAPQAQVQVQASPEYPGPQYAPQVPTAAQAAGEWQFMDGEGWVWVPAGATTYNVENTPYVYLYTPSYGWTWYASPWGWGPYYRGGWIHHPFWGAGGWAHYYGGRRVYGAAHYGGARYGGHYGGHYGGGHYGGGGHFGGHGGGGHGGHR